MLVALASPLNQPTYIPNHVGWISRRRHPTFWDHTIRDEHDYCQPVNYAHFNSLKHGLVGRVIGFIQVFKNRLDQIYIRYWCGE